MTCPCCGSNNVRTYYDDMRPGYLAWIYCDGCRRRSPDMFIDDDMDSDAVDVELMAAWQATQGKQPAAEQR